MLIAGFQTTTSSDAAGAGLAIGFLILYLLALLVGLLLFVWTILSAVDLFKHPDPVWAAAGQNKTTAIVVLAVGFFVCCNLGAPYYWFAVKPKLEEAERGGAAGYSGYAG